MNDPIPVRFSEYDRAKLVEILEEDLARFKALSELVHCTDAERQVFHYRMALLQALYVQLEGTTWQPAHGAPDWSAAEASGKMPSEVLKKVLAKDADQA